MGLLKWIFGDGQEENAETECWGEAPGLTGGITPTRKLWQNELDHELEDRYEVTIGYGTRTGQGDKEDFSVWSNRRQAVIADISEEDSRGWEIDDTVRWDNNKNRWVKL